MHTYLKYPPTSPPFLLTPPFPSPPTLFPPSPLLLLAYLPHVPSSPLPLHPNPYLQINIPYKSYLSASAYPVLLLVASPPHTCVAFPQLLPLRHRYHTNSVDYPLLRSLHPSRHAPRWPPTPHVFLIDLSTKYMLCTPLHSHRTVLPPTPLSTPLPPTPPPVILPYSPPTLSLLPQPPHPSATFPRPPWVHRLSLLHRPNT